MAGKVSGVRGQCNGAHAGSARGCQGCEDDVLADLAVDWRLIGVREPGRDAGACRVKADTVFGVADHGGGLHDDAWGAVEAGASAAYEGGAVVGTIDEEGWFVEGAGFCRDAGIGEAVAQEVFDDDGGLRGDVDEGHERVAVVGELGCCAGGAGVEAHDIGEVLELAVVHEGALEADVAERGHLEAAAVVDVAGDELAAGVFAHRAQADVAEGLIGVEGVAVAVDAARRGEGLQALLLRGREGGDIAGGETVPGVWSETSGRW